MNANNDWEKAKQAVDDAMGAVYDALHHLNEKVDELMQTPVVDEKKGRAVVFLCDSRRHNPHEARIPALVRKHDDVSVGARNLRNGRKI